VSIFVLFCERTDMTVEIDVSARTLARHEADALSVGFVDY